MATLELYLVRHGLAGDRGPDYPDDSKRPLTSDGIKRLRQEAKALDILGVAFDQILSSPYVRARQTADVFAEFMKAHAPVSTIDALTPEGTPDDVVQAIQKPVRKGRLALVGHEPNLGELAAFLIGAQLPLPFKKGGIGRIDFAVPPAQAKGTLVWLVTPRMLREIA